MTDSRANVRSNHAADIESTRAWENIDQPSPIAPTQATVTPIVNACSRSRGIQATSVVQMMLPTDAGMKTNEIMSGSMTT